MGDDLSTWRSCIGRFGGGRSRIVKEHYFRRRNVNTDAIITKTCYILLPEILSTLNALAKSPELIYLCGDGKSSRLNFHEGGESWRMPNHHYGVPIFNGKVKIPPRTILIIEALLILGGNVHVSI